MNQDDLMLAFVKGRLEEGEGIAPEALCRLTDEARLRAAGPGWRRRAAGLLAASLAVAAGGWLAFDALSERRHVADVENALALVRMADGCEESAFESLAENLLAFQDAPLQDGIGRE